MCFDRCCFSGRVVLLFLGSALAVGCRSTPPQAEKPSRSAGAIYETSMGRDGRLNTRFVREVSEEEAAQGLVTTTTIGPSRRRPSSDTGMVGKGPPEVVPGNTVVLDWDGTGPSTGEILEVEGAWVKLRITKTETLSEDPASKASQGALETVIAVGFDVWVNFDELAWYRAPRTKP